MPCVPQSSLPVSTPVIVPLTEQEAALYRFSGLKIEYDSDGNIVSTQNSPLTLDMDVSGWLNPSGLDLR